MNTTVVSLKGRIRDYGPRLENAPAGLVYVGRAWTMGGWQLPGHPLANPFTVRRCGSPEAAVAAYSLYLLDHPDLFALAVALRGSTLACWCAPRLCHAHPVARIADGMTPERLRAKAAALATP